MKDSLVKILKTGAISSGLLVCRNDEERMFLKRFVSESSDVRHGVNTGSVPVADQDSCSKCPSVTDRKRPFGTGINRVMIVLNAPRMSGKGEIEFYRAESAELLKKMLASIGLELNECYITNLVKCESRDPFLKPSDMVRNCLPVLKSEIDRIEPEIVIVMGEIVPLQPVVNSSRGISWFNTEHSISLVKNPELKRPAWETLKLVKKKLQELDDERPHA